jgi:peptidoglycan/xylan/chitin deacetylase (PgdA/CDA1 family)
VNRALVLTYHAVQEGDGPLFVDPATFADHLDVIVDSGVDVVTVSELATRLKAGALPRPAVALTFDDGIASVARTAAPLLAERELAATVFCVAGHLGGENDWDTALPGGPRFALATTEELSGLVEQGLEIGCHGMTHAPLVTDSAAFLGRELVEAKKMLELAAGAPVAAFAYPYGATPTSAARRQVDRSFDSAWTTVAGYAVPGSDLHLLPRVDAHYVRRPRLLRAALGGSLSPYLGARRLGAVARRALHQDYALRLEAS